MQIEENRPILILFAHRFYNPRLMRWQTPDPLSFEDGLNLYTYVRNNPFIYRDPDGRFVFLIPLVTCAFGSAGITISVTTASYIINTAVAAAVVWGTSELYHKFDQDRLYHNAVEKGNEAEGEQKPHGPEEKNGK